MSRVLGGCKEGPCKGPEAEMTQYIPGLGRRWVSRGEMDPETLQ